MSRIYRNAVFCLLSAVASLYFTACNSSVQSPRLDTGSRPVQITRKSTPIEPTPLHTQEATLENIILSPTPEIEKNDCLYDLHFVEDLNYPDNVIVQKNTRFAKKWLVTNTGNCDIEGSQLIYFSGDNMNGNNTSLPFIPEGESREVSVDLVSPSLPGIYRSTWKASVLSPNGESVSYGQELWAQIVVPGNVYEKNLVVVVLDEQRLYAYEGGTNGQLKYSFLVSTGMAGPKTETPVTPIDQPYIINSKYLEDDMDGRPLGFDYYLEDVPYVMYFYQGYALHGAPWRTFFGAPGSHGCVNLSVEDAKQLFEMMNLDDPVIVVNRFSDLYNYKFLFPEDSSEK